MVTTSRRGYLGPYYLSPAGWTPKTSNPFLATVGAAEVRRLSAPWSAPRIMYADGLLHYNPVTTAQVALGDYTRFLATRDRRFLSFFLKGAAWLVSRQQADGSWRYDFQFGDLAPGWTSAMAQGLGISVLTRAYAETGDRRYLAGARRAYDYMMRPVEDGGTLGHIGENTPFLEEYAGSQSNRNVLNGSIFALWGVRDLWVLTGDARALNTWTNLVAGLSQHLSAFDLGNWSCYRAGDTKPASILYHQVQTAQLRVVGVQSGISAYGTYSDLFYRYLLAGRP